MELNEKTIHTLDKSNMLGVLLDFPRQLKEAWEIGKATRLPTDPSGVKNIVLAGMGGSAIGGDLLRSCLAKELRIPLIVNRHYFLPSSVNEATLVFVSSYSGNTEETLQAYKDARKKRAQMVCLTSDGELAQWAQRDGLPLITIPPEYPPRTALGYLTIPILVVLGKLGFIDNKGDDLRETIELLGALVEKYAPSTTNLAKEVSQKLVGKIPLVYSSVEGFDVVALRWKGQFSENSEILAFCNYFPELNHNEIVGWGLLKEIQKHFQVILLRDEGDYPRIQRRMEVTKEILQQETWPVIEVYSQGRSLLTRIFSLIYLGDFVSFYLAILNGVDPTPVKKIDYLKERLKTS
jgi:glucose/mannose-6-phosphate isomerase